MLNVVRAQTECLPEQLNFISGKIADAIDFSAQRGLATTHHDSCIAHRLAMFYYFGAEQIFLEHCCHLLVSISIALA